MSNDKAECFPVIHFVEEELLERKVPVKAFINLVGISKSRWETIQAGKKGLLISEAEKIAGALGVNVQFIVNLNAMYMDWKFNK